MNNDFNAPEKQGNTPVFQPSSRSSHRSEFEAEETAEERLIALVKASDSISVPEIVETQPGAEVDQNANKRKDSVKPPSCDTRHRINEKQLVELLGRLSARDLNVLQTVRKYRFMTSDQVGRLFFQHCTTKTSQTRNQNLLLKRLNGHGLIKALERRIGGYGGGSGMQIWYLTTAGQRLLTLNEPDILKRKRVAEPSTMFIAHTLAITEMAVQMTTLCHNSHDLELIALDTEPTSWRRFNDNAKAMMLKPDMFAILSYDHYEDRYFMEMDLSTESPRQVVDKCDQYLRYYYSGIEQRETGMFPFVVWVVKDESRKKKLKEI